LDGILVDEAHRLNKVMFLFKVDYEKAYDLVNFHYLDAVLLKMNFLTLWRKWISNCDGPATTSDLVTGVQRRNFLWKWGFGKDTLFRRFYFC